MNSNTNDVPFHERHDDELLTLEDVAQILKTSENTVRWWRQTGTGRSSSRSAGGCTPRSATCAASSASSAWPPSPSSVDPRRCETWTTRVTSSSARAR